MITEFYTAVAGIFLTWLGLNIWIWWYFRDATFDEEAQAYEWEKYEKYQDDDWIED